MRKDDNVRGGGGRAKEDIRITCGGEVKKWTFHDDAIFGQPVMGSIEPGWKGLTRKIVLIGRELRRRLLRIVINYWNCYPKINDFWRKN